MSAGSGEAQLLRKYSPAGNSNGPDGSAGMGDRTSLREKRRGDGLERRPPAGIAQERETSGDDVGPYQGEGRVFFMTGGVCRRTRSCGFLPVGGPADKAREEGIPGVFRPKRNAERRKAPVAVKMQSPGSREPGPPPQPGGPQVVHRHPPSWGTGTGPAALRALSATPMYGSRRPLGFPPRREHLGTGGSSRRPPSAGCADQRSAFQAVPAPFLPQRCVVFRAGGAIRTVGVPGGTAFSQQLGRLGFTTGC